MAVATTVRKDARNPSLYGTVNLRVIDPTNVVAGSVLTIGGDLVLTVVHELPNNSFKTEVTTCPRGHGHLLIQRGETVTGP